MNQADQVCDVDKTSSGPSADHVNPQKQFGISALFWLTFMIGLGIAYLHDQDSPDILIGGLVSVAAGMAVGAIVGSLAGRMGDAVFWATLIAAFGYIATAGDRAFDWEHRLIWAMVGAVTGAVGAVGFPKKIVPNAIACAASAGAVMFTFWIVTQRQSVDLRFDLFAAPLIGAAIAFFLRSLDWLDSRRKMPRYITATWLLVVVIIGSVLSR